MDEEGEEYEEVEETSGVPALRFDPLLALAISFQLFADVHEAFSSFWDDLSTTLCAHFRWKERQMFLHEQMTREIETLTRE